MRNRASACALCLSSRSRAGLGPDAARAVCRHTARARRRPGPSTTWPARLPWLPDKRDKNNDARPRFASSAFRTRRFANCLVLAIRWSSAEARMPGFSPGSVFSCGASYRQVTTTGPTPPPTIHTSGWVQILGVDTMVSTATVVHACDGILFDDYLEPFVAPMIAARPLPGSTPQYDNMGHIVTGVEGLHTRGARQRHDHRSRQQFRRRPWPAVPRLQRQARPAHRHDRPIEGLRRHGDAIRRSLKSVRSWSSPCGPTMRPCRSSRRETRSRTAI